MPIRKERVVRLHLTCDIAGCRNTTIAVGRTMQDAIAGAMMQGWRVKSGRFCQCKEHARVRLGDLIKSRCRTVMVQQR